MGVVNIASNSEPQNPKEVFFPKLATDQKINIPSKSIKISGIPNMIAQVVESIVVFCFINKLSKNTSFHKYDLARISVLLLTDLE